MLDGQPLILLVEDNDDARLMYTQYLTFHGCQVIEAADGEAGLRHALQQGPDIIILDLGLPTLDGWEVTRHLKADPRTAQIPVLVVTGYGPDFPRMKTDSVVSKFDALFLKPCSPPALLAKIREMLNQKDQGAG
jgi:two-component system, cell cycle response regulator DivK